MGATSCQNVSWLVADDVPPPQAGATRDMSEARIGIGICLLVMGSGSGEVRMTDDRTNTRVACSRHPLTKLHSDVTKRGIRAAPVFPEPGLWSRRWPRSPLAAAATEIGDRIS